MKKVFIIALLALCSSSYAQNNVSASHSLQQLLTYYYGVKDALTKDDDNTASSNAEKLLQASRSIDIQTLSAQEQKAFSSVKEAIEHNADHISEVNDIDHQREHFAALSKAMSTLAQSVSLSQQPVYLDYCPMKKEYWLSNDKFIQNPYYGKQMPDCGSVQKTIKPGMEHSMKMDDAKSMSDTMPMKNMSHAMDGMQAKDSGMNMNGMNNMPMDSA